MSQNLLDELFTAKKLQTKEKMDTLGIHCADAETAMELAASHEIPSVATDPVEMIIN